MRDCVAFLDFDGCYFVCLLDDDGHDEHIHEGNDGIGYDNHSRTTRASFSYKITWRSTRRVVVDAKP